MPFTRRLIPDDEVETVGVPIVLAANRAATGPVRTKVYNNAITELTKNLIERRMALARQVPLARPDRRARERKGCRASPAPSRRRGLPERHQRHLVHPAVGTDLERPAGRRDAEFDLCCAPSAYLKSARSDPMRELLDRLRDDRGTGPHHHQADRR